MKEYFRGELRFKTLLLESQKDERLAEAAQAYYCARGEWELGNAFAFKTKQTFNEDNFETSNQKYVRQFNHKKNLELEYKNDVIQVVENYLKAHPEVTLYKISKDLNMSESNLIQFYNKKKTNMLSIEKAQEVLKYLGLSI